MKRHLMEIGEDLPQVNILDLYQRTTLRPTDWACVLHSFLTLEERGIALELERHANGFVSRDLEVRGSPYWITPPLHFQLRQIIRCEKLDEIAPTLTPRLTRLVYQHAQLEIEELMLIIWKDTLAPAKSRQLLQHFRTSCLGPEDREAIIWLANLFVEILRENYCCGFGSSLFEMGLEVDWTPAFLAVFDELLGFQSEVAIPLRRR